jgi:cell division protein ZapA
MQGQSSTDGEAIAVTIFGRTYHLRGADNPQHLVELASIVDGKMREIADGTGTADSLKVAILASLNLADEYLRSDLDDDTPASVRAEKRLGQMVTLLDAALVE